MRDGRAALGALFDVAAPAGSNGRVISFFAPENVQVRPGTEQLPSAQRPDSRRP